MCHNLAHETLGICRELQKRNLHNTIDVHLLMWLYTGQCTSVLAKWRNFGYFRKLSDEFRKCIGEEPFAFIEHHAGHDAAKSARLFLHYHGASVVSFCAESKNKKVKVADSCKHNESC